MKRLFQYSSLCILLTACHATTLNTSSAELGSKATLADLLEVIEQPGPIRFQKHLAATWAVDRSGLINLDHPKAVMDGLGAGEEQIELYVYTLDHPDYGVYIVDSGISESFRKPAENSDIGYLIGMAMNTDKLSVKKTTRELSEEYEERLKGVFLTHIHLDHIMGLSDLPDDIPVYIGPGDAQLSAFMNLFTQGTTDRLLGSVDHLREWSFEPPTENTAGLIDIFGDGSVWALHSPGHSPGSTAYLVRTTKGSELLIGDVTHTRWGWLNGVEPGTFSDDVPRSVVSLRALKALAERVPGLGVHPGHQSLQN